MRTKFLALAAMVLGLASCQQEFNGVTPLEGEVDFQLGVSAPELITRAGDAENAPQNAWNSAYGAIDYLQALEATVSDDYRTDWTEVDLRYTLEVYDKADNYAGATPVKDRQVIIVDEYQPVTFDLRLIPNRQYHFVVFADFVAQGASNDPAIDVQGGLGLHHTIGATLQDITIKAEADAINDECTDAYFATSDITISNSAANGMELKRPYGKVRVIATDLAELNLNVNPTKVKVEYYAKHPQTFNAVTGTIGAEVEEAYTLISVYNEGVSKESLANHFYTTGYDAETTTNANDATRHTHMTLFTDYILAGDEQSPISFDMTVYEGNEVIKFTEFSTNIPVQRNHLTTIIGNVLTTATEINVTIDDNFAGEHIVYTEDYTYDEATNTYYVNNANGLATWAYVAANTTTSPNLKLMNNIELPKKTIEPDDANKRYTFTGEDITVVEGIPSGSNWPAISDYETSYNSEKDVYEYYEGVIDGNGYTISGLRINHDFVASGFLCWTKGAKVDNLTFDDAVVYNKGGQYGETYTGIIIGRCWDGSHVNNCHIKNSSVLGKNEVGGVVGRVYRRTIKTNTPDGQPQNLMENLAYVTYCTTDENTTVKGQSSVGGIAGMNYGCIVGQCINNAQVSATGDYAGGIVGYHRSYTTKTDGYIIACKSTSKATIRSKYAGGIAGYVLHDKNHLYTKSWIVGCASESTISGTTNAGGIIGNATNATISSCWALQNGTTKLAGKGTSTNIASYMYSNATNATQADIDAMNAAIEAFNTSDHNISLDGTVGTEMLKRWALVDGVPVLQ